MFSQVYVYVDLAIFLGKFYERRYVVSGKDAKAIMASGINLVVIESH